MPSVAFTSLSSLFVRLSLVCTFILAGLGLLTLWVSHRSAEAYFLEFTQRLNAPIAMYMADNVSLVVDGEPDAEALSYLSHHAMMINPSVEVYLLNADGEIVAHSLAPEELSLNMIALEPIQEFLNQPDRFPVFGDNPKSAERKDVFSAHPLLNQGQTVGYVYVVLGGEKHRTLLSSVADSYSMQSLLFMISGVFLLGLLTSGIVFFMLTRRLRRLTNNVLSMATKPASFIGTRDRPNIPSMAVHRDEISALTDAYEAMAHRLMDQNQELEEKDRYRREFLANISHDLRTPLTTLQSYLETLHVKRDVLTEEDRRSYVKIAHKQSERLRYLILQLFELSRLNSGELLPQREAFSLLEFVHDTCQDFSVRAAQKQITLSVLPVSDRANLYDVDADIAMVHRVFENLIDNALKHTSVGGGIVITMTRDCSNYVNVSVTDSGSSPREISPSSCKSVANWINDSSDEFKNDLRYQSELEEIKSQSSGLGLSIVRSILGLHGCQFELKPIPSRGTRAEFRLPANSVELVDNPPPKRAHQVASR